MAQAKLTKLKQLKGESIQNFCERIFALAEEAYVGQDLASPVIQSILVDTLIRGALNDHLSKALIKNKPKTLDAALYASKLIRKVLSCADVRKSLWMYLL